MTKAEVLAEDRKRATAAPMRHAQLVGAKGCDDPGCPVCRWLVPMPSTIERRADAAALMENKQKPSIGRIVHYFPNGETAPQAAIVIAVDSDEVVKLQVCNAGGTWNTRPNVPFDDAPGATRERWCWPPRV
jgi:hypothetical protein